jgi:hypothetical protein
LFVLDARPPGHLSVYSVEDVHHPRLVGRSLGVPVGPFSGVSAAGGLCVVSGGTSQLTVWRYDDSGLTDSIPAFHTDLGRGQPNALIAKDGERAFVATHYYGPYFGLETIGFQHDSVVRLGSVELPEAGFTEGGAKPASFPIALSELDDGRLLAAYGQSLSSFRTQTGLELEWTLDLPGPVVGLAVSGSRALASTGGRRPELIEVSTGDNPHILRRRLLPPGTKPLGVALTPASAAVAARERGVLGFK